MKTFKVLHTADWHLRDKDIDECEKCTGAVMDKALEEKPDLTVIAADIFDSQDIEAGSKAALLAITRVSSLADVSPVVIVRGTPSHDGNAPSILAHVRGAFPIVVADMPMQVAMQHGEFFFESIGTADFKPDAIISLAPTPTKQYFQTTSGIKESDHEIAQAMSDLFKMFGAQAAPYNCPHILVGHWNISGSKLPSGYERIGMDIEISTDQMMLANPDLGCLGHIHIAQQLGGRFFFSGPLYATKVDEQKTGFWIHELTPANGVFGLASRYFETPSKKTVRLADNFASPSDACLDRSSGTTITDCLIGESASIPDVSGTMVRHEIKVWQDETSLVDKKQIREFYIAAGALDADIRIVPVPRENVRSEKVLAAANLVDKLVAMAEIKGEKIPESVLLKAKMLDSMPLEDILKVITGADSAERKAA